MSGSIWNEPEDWMMASLKDELMYGYTWDQRNMPNNVKTIFLSAGAMSRDEGYILVEFAFNNEKDCENRAQDKAGQAFE